VFSQRILVFSAGSRRRAASVPRALVQLVESARTISHQVIGAVSKEGQRGRGLPDGPGTLDLTWGGVEQLHLDPSAARQSVGPGLADAAEPSCQLWHHEPVMPTCHLVTAVLAGITPVQCVAMWRGCLQA